jgi:hypothetical protein
LLDLHLERLRLLLVQLCSIAPYDRAVPDQLTQTEGNMNRQILPIVLLPMLLSRSMATAAEPPTTAPAAAPSAQVVPSVLPGNGMAQHDFFYAGESKQRKMFIVRKGAVVWSYDDPTGKGEISDATMLSNGNILLAHQFAVQLITQEKKEIWSYAVPKGSEVHTALPIGINHVLFVQNGAPAFVRVVNIATGQTEKQFDVPTKTPRNVHVHFRHARLTEAGTLLLAHMDLGKVNEYDSDGKILRSIDTPGVWGVTPLKGGNILIAGSRGVEELDPTDKIVWSLSRADLPGYKLSNLQNAWRLPNGNTLFNCWVNEWTGAVDPATAPAQAIEVTPDKKVVWAMHQYSNPDLGPATTIQILDEPETPEQVSFGNIK